jgi:hypothetical protein
LERRAATRASLFEPASHFDRWSILLRHSVYVMRQS